MHKMFTCIWMDLMMLETSLSLRQCLHWLTQEAVLSENITDWMNNLVQLPASDTIYLPFYWILRPDPSVFGCIFNGFGSCHAYLSICQPAVCECWLCLGLLSHTASAGLLLQSRQLISLTTNVFMEYIVRSSKILLFLYWLIVLNWEYLISIIITYQHGHYWWFTLNKLP